MKYMNKFVKEIGMNGTNIYNAHGLPNSRNFSTCEDVMKLCKEAMGLTWFREIIKTQ